MVTDTDGKIIDVNPAFEKITGYVKEEVVGKNPSILSSGKHDANFYKMMWKNIKTKGHWQGEIWNKRKDGQIYQELLTISAIRNNTGDIQYYVGIFNDVSNKG